MSADELDLPIECVAVMFAITIQIIAKMEEAEIEDRPSSSAIPRGVLNCEEARMLAGMSLVMASKLYPDLLDTETLMQKLRGARMPVPTIN